MERTLIQIPYQTQIGEGLYIGHFGHIIINPSCKIGKNFNIAAGVLIGNAQGKYAGTPTIGDNVKVGQNAIIIGNPGKIIQRNSSPTARYIVYPVQNY
ncbi:hypothetical protein [Bacteroides acidifaciens]|uniref:hypothetical protein n=1 Tax=Bacteroides acidifaciens TaxID=85831 RepID=UPI0024319509|nr:hypothetical protein [Bacteroides acidifaciens]